MMADIFGGVLELAGFKPIAHGTPSLLSTYQSMLKKQVVSAHLLPFANG